LNSGVIITGASTGIGASCALHLDALGLRVFAGIRNAADGDALRAKSSSRLLPLPIDVTDSASIAAAVGMVQSQLGDAGLGGLVNNAGIAVGGPLEMLPLDELRRQFEVNVVGQLAVTQAFLPLLRKARGRIVNIGSIAGRVPLPLVGPYSMSKFALNAMTKSLRLEVDAWGIKVAIIEPGAIATPIWKKSTAAADALYPGQNDVLYGEHFACIRNMITEAEQHAIPADAVASAVAHALTARRPRTHYLVGTDAKVRALLNLLLPQRAQDALHRWFLKLPRKI
jgi:NAD(P)-dependent dehydrogenase (short-subunit alcohol dehydrogenase family)